MRQGGREARRVTLITGASGGIGAGLARVFARHGHVLALVARRAKLEALADEIGVRQAAAFAAETRKDSLFQ